MDQLHSNIYMNKKRASVFNNNWYAYMYFVLNKISKLSQTKHFIIDAPELPGDL